MVKEKKVMEKAYLSNQAVGAVMMALQQSLLEQSDIVPVLRGFELQMHNDELVVINPPTVRMDTPAPSADTETARPNDA
jgi:hypothetical protein